MIAEIIVDNRSKNVDKPFDYVVPAELENKVTVGSRVIVPFSSGNREIEGFCVGVKNKRGGKRLKSIIRTVDDAPAFDSDMLELIEWLRERTLASYLDIIHTIIPSGSAVKSREWLLIDGANDKSGQTAPLRNRILEIISDNGGGIEYDVLKSMFETDIQAPVREMIKRGILKKEYRQTAAVSDKNIRCIRLAVPAEEAVKSAGTLCKRAPVQARMLDILMTNDIISVSDLVRFADGSNNAANALVNKGLAEFFTVRAERDPYMGRVFKKSEKLNPTPEQATAISRINRSIDNADSRTYLLHGVTGSGKTEVFMQVIEHAVSLGKTAIMLVPEISLTPQMVSRFMSRFQSRIAIIHSGLSLGERYDQWKRIRDGGADIVIGARSAVFAPLKNMGIIIMDEEHSDTYKSEMSPRYHTRDVAMKRAGLSGAALVLASATPSVESYYKSVSGEYMLLEMNTRYNKNKMPDIYVEDMRSELARGNRSMLSNRMYGEIEKNLERGEQTILFLNRRGFSTFVSCRTCGYVPECPNCSITLTYHKYEGNLKCHYCGYTQPNYVICPSCGSRYIRYFGGGTQRVEEEIKRLFPKASIIRMDMDTTGKKQSHEKILKRFEKERTDILIGTQMVAKGLDFENVTLVGVISADTMLHIHDFRSGERTFAMLEQVTGRAGRGSKLGRAVIQTYTPEHEAVGLVRTHDYKAFYKSEIKERELMWYPPFCKIVSVHFQGASETLVPQAARYFVKEMGELSGMGQKIQLLGPIAAYISKIKNKYRWQIIFKCEDDGALGKELKRAETALRANKDYGGVSVIIDKSPNMIY